jgi:hypothetical protein
MAKAKLIVACACACACLFIAGCECRGENMQEVLTVSADTVQPCLASGGGVDSACAEVCRAVFELDNEADIIECTPVPSDAGSAGDYDLYTEYTLPAQCPRR